jgi:shikimate kinase
MERACRILLVGMMGSGKTTVGHALAARTGWPYIDNDELLDRLTGATPKQLLARDGEATLRESESAALRLGLGTPAPSVIGVAAGTILDTANRAALREHSVVVWLRATPETLEERSWGAAHRAWLEEGGAAWIRKTASARDPLYASVSQLTLDVDERSADDLAREIHSWACRAVESCQCDEGGSPG